MHLMLIVATRPNFVKTAALIPPLKAANFDVTLVHTGQHYDRGMSGVFFDELGLPKPDYNLNTGSGSHVQQISNTMLAFEQLLTDHRPDWVAVFGDVNATAACALTASRMGIKVAHVEAGLRAFDYTLPEESNRILTDHVADILFASTEEACENLKREGIPQSMIKFVGNLMIDTLTRQLERADRRSLLRHGLHPGKYILVTLHRPFNVDSLNTLKQVLEPLERLAHTVPVVFPVHPRLKKNLDIYFDKRQSPIHFFDALGYIDFLSLVKSAGLVITDSGGVQEEAGFLNVPCLVLRPNTERPLFNQNKLISSDVLEEEARKLLASTDKPKSSPPKLWDGHTAERIVYEFQVLACLPVTIAPFTEECSTITIVIPAWGEMRWMLTPFLLHLKRRWDNLPVDLVVISDVKLSLPVPGRVIVFPSSEFPWNFSGVFRSVLEQVTSDIVFFSCVDMFLTQPLDVERLMLLAEYMRTDPKILRGNVRVELALTDVYGHYSVHAEWKGLRIIRCSEWVHCSTVDGVGLDIALYNRQNLIRVLEPNQSIQDCEAIATRQARAMGFYGVATQPFLTDCQGLRRSCVSPTVYWHWSFLDDQDKALLSQYQPKDLVWGD